MLKELIKILKLKMQPISLFSFILLILISVFVAFIVFYGLDHFSKTLNNQNHLIEIKEISAEEKLFMSNMKICKRECEKEGLQVERLEPSKNPQLENWKCYCS